MRLSICYHCNTIYYCPKKNPPKTCDSCTRMKLRPINTEIIHIQFNSVRTKQEHLYYQRQMDLHKNYRKCKKCHNNAFMNDLCFFHNLNQHYELIHEFYFKSAQYDEYLIEKRFNDFLNYFYEKTEKGKINYCCFICNNKHFTKLKDAFFHNLICKGTQKIYRNYLNLKNKDYRMNEIKEILGLIAYFKFPGFEDSLSTFFIKNVISYLMGDQDKSIMNIINDDLMETYPDIELVSDIRPFYEKLSKKTQICKKCNIFYNDANYHKNYVCKHYCEYCKNEFIGLEDFNLHKSNGAQQCKYCSQTFWCNNINIHKEKYCYVSCKFCNKKCIGKLNLQIHKQNECIKIPCNKCHFKGVDHICDNNGWPLLHQLCIEIN